MITLGGDLRVGRIGNGAMRLTGFHCGCVYGNHHVVAAGRCPSKEVRESHEVQAFG
jgi:hypothetical protein